MNQNRTVFDIDEETDAFYLQKAVEYHEWLIQQEAQPRLTRTPIFRDREDAERRLRADYFDDHCLGFLKPLVLAVFVLSITRASNPQLHFGNRYTNLIGLTFIFNIFNNGLRIYVVETFVNIEDNVSSSMGGSSIDCACKAVVFTFIPF
ncbi:hypothetical protein Tco_1247534 [Tanacetum coccineum]